MRFLDIIAHNPLDLDLCAGRMLSSHHDQEVVISAAVVFEQYGPPEVLRLVEVPTPEPGPGQLLVRVCAAGVQPFDALFRSGVLSATLPATFPQGLGNELAGIVVGVGHGAAWSIGDEVLGWAERSCYAEHVLTESGNLVAKPAGMAWEQAGALSASEQTAATALDHLGVGAGDVLLVHAAAGGVGTMATQLARGRRAAVIGTAAPANHDYLRSLGVVPVAYGPGLADRVLALAPGGVTAALDAVGTREAIEASLALVATPGRVVTLVRSDAADELGVERIATRRSAAGLERLAQMHARGDLSVLVSGAYPLAEVAAAHRRLEQGHVRGKLVLTP